MGESGSGTFFSIRPKVAIIMILYITLAYCCCFAFASSSDFSNADEGIILYNAGTIDVKVNETEPTEEEQSQNQGIDLGLLLGGGGGLFSLWALSRGGSEKKEIFKWVSIFSPLMASTGYVAGYGLSKVGVNLHIGEAVELIMMFIGHIYNLIYVMLDFLTFGIIDNPQVPSIPYPFNIIPLVMVFPVFIVVVIWLAGLIIEGLKALFKVPLSG